MSTDDILQAYNSKRNWDIILGYEWISRGVSMAKYTEVTRFHISKQDLAIMEAIKQWLKSKTFIDPTNSDALRHALRYWLDQHKEE